MIFDLGLISYSDAYGIQRDFVERRRLGWSQDFIIVAEHPAIFTVGKGRKMKGSSVNGIPLISVDRGGDITFHGPGQIVIYPILDLKQRVRDLHKYLRDLEAVVIEFLKLYDVDGRRIGGKTGVWVDGEKIASIGVGSNDWITYHGLSVNVNVDLSFFSMIDPCGMPGVTVTSLNKILGQGLSMDEAKKGLITSFGKVFGVSPYPVLRYGREVKIAENR